MKITSIILVLATVFSSEGRTVQTLPVTEIPSTAIPVRISSTNSTPDIFSKPDQHFVVHESSGPVIQGLMDVVNAVARAIQHVVAETTSVATDVEHTIMSQMQTLTTSGLSDLYLLLSKIETEIEDAAICGLPYADELSSIFAEIEIGCNECFKNLTLIHDMFANNTIGALATLSTSVEGVWNILDSCQVRDNLIVGMFCTVNNIAEINDRVIASVATIKEQTKLAIQASTDVIEPILGCKKNLTTTISAKAKALSEEVKETCTLPV